MPRMLPVPSVGSKQSAERLDDGGLAGAVGAEEAEELSLADLEADVVDRGERAEADGEVIGCDDGGHSRRTVADMPDFRICCGVVDVDLDAEDLVLAVALGLHVAGQKLRLRRDLAYVALEGTIAEAVDVHRRRAGRGARGRGRSPARRP